MAEALLPLSNAKTPDFVGTVVRDAWKFRHEGIPRAKKLQWAEALSTSEEQLDQLTSALTVIVRESIYSEGKSVPLPEGLHPGLRKLLVQIVMAGLPEWKEATAGAMVGPPRLVDFDWRVDMKTSSNHLSRMAVPTVLVEMKLQETPARVGVMPGVRDVKFELTREALGTMLDGLEKIRDQLSGISPGNPGSAATAAVAARE